MIKYKNIISIIIFLLFLSMIPMANYAISHIGFICLLNRPCLIPIWRYPIIYAPSGVIFVGLAFVLRDILQRITGLYTSITAVIIGSIISYFLNDPTLALACCIAFFLSEISETFIYNIMQKYNLILAVITSAFIGIIIDSFVFLHLAFHSFEFILGQIIGKFLMVILSIPFIKFFRNNYFESSF